MLSLTGSPLIFNMFGLPDPGALPGPEATLTDAFAQTMASDPPPSGWMVGVADGAVGVGADEAQVLAVQAARETARRLAEIGEFELVDRLVGWVSTHYGPDAAAIVAGPPGATVWARLVLPPPDGYTGLELTGEVEIDGRTFGIVELDRDGASGLPVGITAVGLPLGDPGEGLEVPIWIDWGLPAGYIPQMPEPDWDSEQELFDAIAAVLGW